MQSGREEPESQYNALDDLSIPPEKALEMLINELRHPLNSIDGWVEILRLEGTENIHSETIEMIPRCTQSIRSTLQTYLIYVEKRKALNTKKGDAGSP